MKNFSRVVGELTTSGQSLAVDVLDASSIIFHLRNSGTVTMNAGTFVFEGSVDSTNGIDGTWFGIQACRSNANTIETQIAVSGLTAGSGYAAAWEASVNGLRWMRLRATVTTTTNSKALWTVQRSWNASEPIPAVQVSATQPVSGSVTVSGTATVTPTTGSAYSLTTAASTNAAVVKNTAGNVYELTISNPTATAAYVKLYNKTTAPTVGTDVPVMTVPAPANSFTNVKLGVIGKRFTTGCSIAVTGGIAATDTANAVAGVQVHATYA